MKRLLCISVILLWAAFKHPFYLSVTELKYKPGDKSLQGSVKLFTSDLEEALKRLNKKTIDLINTKDTVLVNRLLNNYLKDRLLLKLNGKDRRFDFIGYEREEEAIWAYIEFKNCEPPKKIELNNTLLFDYLAGQTNIVQVEVNGEKKSAKASNPDKDFLFNF